MENNEEYQKHLEAQKVIISDVLVKDENAINWLWQDIEALETTDPAALKLKLALEALMQVDAKKVVVAYFEAEGILPMLLIREIKDFLEEKLDSDDEWWTEMYSQNNTILLPVEPKESIYSADLREMIQEVYEDKGAQFLTDLLAPHTVMGR